MLTKKNLGVVRYLAFLPLLLLGGCDSKHFWLFSPDGPIAAAELNYMVLDVAIMLVIIIPTILFAIWAIVRYRKHGGKGGYAPTWSHSTKLEFLVWGVPILVVIALSYYSYVGTHEVNPWNPTVITSQASYKKAQPLEVDVIATDWQWLFIYPQQGVAVSNQLVVPVNRPVNFNLTSTAVTNNFFIPQVVGQVYVMPGMRSKQSLVVDKTGNYHGLSAALSGPGFSWMHFDMKAVTAKDFTAWIAKTRQSSDKLSYADFEKFAQPTVNMSGKVTYYTNVQPGLFPQVIQNVRDGKLTFATPELLTEDMKSDEFKKHSN